MAYYSGTAGSLAALNTALLTHAQADGWTLTGNVLSKAGVYFQITADATNIKCLGCESNAVANPAPGPVMIGKGFNSSAVTIQISFPCNYEVFGFAQELYLVVNYDVDRYQWMAFGKSTVPGLPGQGGFCSASAGTSPDAGSYPDPLNITSSGGQPSGVGQMTPAPFWVTSGNSGPTQNSWVNHGLDGHGWTWNGTVFDSVIGIRWMSTLIDIQPSAWNSEAALLPIRAYKERPSYKSSLIVDLAFARHFRIDNMSPGDILTLGSDKWKVFPWYRKDAANRNGGPAVNHTGTFGWAIRYEGP